MGVTRDMNTLREARIISIRIVFPSSILRKRTNRASRFVEIGGLCLARWYLESFFRCCVVWRCPSGPSAYSLVVVLCFFSMGCWASELLNVLRLESQYVRHPVAF